MDLEFSTFQRQPAYRYITPADCLPTMDEIGCLDLDEVVCTVKLFNPTGRAGSPLLAPDADGASERWGGAW